MSADYTPTNPSSYAAISARAIIIARARLPSVTALTAAQLRSPEHEVHRMGVVSQIVSMARNELYTIGTEGLTPTDWDYLARDVCGAIGS